MYSIELMDDKSEKLKYNAGELPVKSALTRREDYPSPAVLSHWHTDYEFSFVTKGSMLYNVNGEVVTLEAGQMIFVNSGQMHFGFWDKPCECEFICTIFHPSLIRGAAYCIEKISGEKSPPYILFDEKKLPEKILFDCISEINNVVAESCDGFELKLLSHIYGLSFSLYEYISSCETNPPKNLRKIETMRRMTGFINQNFARKISLADIAGAGLVCRSECCKIFKEYLGRTPAQYLNEYRIAKSAELLEAGTGNITEIALACGFSSSSYFAESFLKVMKCSPTQYRERYRRTHGQHNFISSRVI